ncbi:MAG: hypothetical protein CBC42_03345 [Betaproteobacteria bacterium TMED82]|nr:MAG: hypothetical protein CBC42_03345 [Betaproteobacteria bacterium TMED82]|tara:strand:- start:61011 stop:61994 length:984 start_codon:yes stop_codon:yes gene_type:complete
MNTYESSKFFLQSELTDFAKIKKANIESDVPLVRDVARYIMDSGGKQLRPLLMFFFQKLLNEGCEQLRIKTIKMAAAIEFIHTATLLHDDVIDSSGLRRNKKTANSIFGNAASILVGDFLYSRAFQIMVQLKSPKIMHVMAETTNLIAEGEVLQLMNCNNPDVTECEYLRVINYKTAKLFEASCMIPGILSNAEDSQITACGEFGVCFGTAFQLTDDVLDYSGSEEEIGKRLGDDLKEGKATLPMINLIQISDINLQKTLKDAIKNPNSAPFTEIAGLMKKSGALEYAASVARDQVKLAQNSLSKLPNNHIQDKLSDLLTFIPNRTA